MSSAKSQPFYLGFNVLTLNEGDQINLVQHSQYHGRWYPGSLRRQDISTHDIDYVD